MNTDVSVGQHQRELPPNQAPHFQPGPAEIQQQAKRQPSRFQIVQALRRVNGLERPDNLQFDQNLILNQ